MEVASESGITEPNQSGLNNEEDNNPGMVQQRIMKDLQNWALCTWWELNKRAILSTLNRKQNDVTGYIKRKLIGKSQYINQNEIYNQLFNICDFVFHVDRPKYGYMINW